MSKSITELNTKSQFNTTLGCIHISLLRELDCQFILCFGFCSFIPVLTCSMVTKRASRSIQLACQSCSYFSAKLNIQLGITFHPTHKLLFLFGASICLVLDAWVFADSPGRDVSSNVAFILFPLCAQLVIFSSSI